MDVFTRSFGTQEGDVKYVLTSCKLCSEEDLKKLKPIEFCSRKHFRISGPPKILEAIQEAHEKKKCPKEWKFLKSPTNTSPACLKIDMKYSDDEVAAQVQSFLENGITRKLSYKYAITAQKVLTCKFFDFDCVSTRDTASTRDIRYSASTVTSVITVDASHDCTYAIDGYQFHRLLLDYMPKNYLIVWTEDGTTHYSYGEGNGASV